MAYSASDITQQEIDDAAEDYPLVMASHVIRDAKDNGSFSALWDLDAGPASNGSLADGSDGSATDNPARFAYDDDANVDTRPNQGLDTWWYLIDSGDASFGDFDCAAILGHNFGTIGATAVELWISDTTDLTAGNKIWDAGAPSDDTRLISLDLDDGANSNPQRFTGVDYIGLKITGTSITPQVGQLWLSRRRQLHNSPMVPYNPDRKVAAVNTNRSVGGNITAYTEHESARELTPRFITSTAAQGSTIDSIYSESGDGGKPIIWIEKPNSAPSTAFVMYMLGSYPGGEYIGGANNRRWEFSLTETSPLFDGES